MAFGRSQVLVTAIATVSSLAPNKGWPGTGANRSSAYRGYLVAGSALKNKKGKNGRLVLSQPWPGVACATATQAQCAFLVVLGRLRT